MAHLEAQRLNHEYIGEEHILLGLIREGSSVAAHVLKDFGVDFAQLSIWIRRRSQFLTPAGERTFVNLDDSEESLLALENPNSLVLSKFSEIGAMCDLERDLVGAKKQRAQSPRTRLSSARLTRQVCV